MPDQGGREEWARHWPQLAGASIGIASGIAVWMYTASVFVIPLENRFGWSRTEIAAAGYASIVAGFVAPFAGRVVDALGARRVATLGMLAIGTIYVGLAQMPASLPAYYALMGLLQVLGLATSGICFSKVITAWFVETRGTALSASRISIALAGACLPIINNAAIVASGWQAGFYVMAGLALLVGLPTCWLLIREPNAERRSQGQPAFWGFLVRRDTMIILLSAAFVYLPLGGLLAQLHPVLVWRDLSNEGAALATSLFAVSAVAGALVTGPLLDRASPRYVAAAIMLLPVCGSLMLLSGAASVHVNVAGVALIAFAQGAEFDIMAFLIARYLGMNSFSAMYGVGVLCTNIAAALGAMMFALNYDVGQNYAWALAAGGASFGVSAILFLLLPNPVTSHPPPR